MVRQVTNIKILLCFFKSVGYIYLNLPLFLDTSDIAAKSCWDYSKLENPYSKLESSYSKLESTYGKLESPYSKLENPYTKLESHYSKLDASPYSKLESHYTSSLASQHFNNIKMDPQQGL